MPGHKETGLNHDIAFGGMSMDNVSFTIEEENLICIYHKHDRRRTIAAISDALPDMDADMRPLAEQTIHKLHKYTHSCPQSWRQGHSVSLQSLSCRRQPLFP